MQGPPRYWLGILIVAFAFLAGGSLLTARADPESVEQFFHSTGIDYPHEEIIRGFEYSQQRRLLFWIRQAIELGLLLTLVFTPFGPRLIALCRRLTLGYWLPTLLLAGLIFLLLEFHLLLPIRLAGFYQMTLWEMTRQPWDEWFRDQVLALAVGMVPAGIILAGLYLLLRFLPRTWWIAAAGWAMALAMVFAYLLPLVVAPLFNTFTPLQETPWKDLEPMVRRLTDRAGVEVGTILVMDASRQSSHSNAYFTGWGSTRRIVLYDTLLEAHSPAEIESILAHEMGHWLHDHIVQGVILGGLGALVGLFLLNRILIRTAKNHWCGMTTPYDPAGLFLVILLFWIGSWLVLPLENAISRHFEREADRMALEHGDADAFIQAEVNLARKNMMNLAPSAWNTFLFASHPPVLERIAMAQSWKKNALPPGP